MHNNTWAWFVRKSHESRIGDSVAAGCSTSVSSPYGGFPLIDAKVSSSAGPVFALTVSIFG